MGFGIDTAAALNDSRFNWGNFKAWKTIWPGFAGRYFGGGYTWEADEFTDFKATTGGICTKIAPLRASQPDRQTGSYSDGETDGTDTCDRIRNAIDAGQLQIPTSGEVYVYLDVEAGTALSSAYWAGWANAVNIYDFNGGVPFYPAIYTQFTNQGGLYLPQPSVQDAVDHACSDYPNADVVVNANWTANPESSTSQCGPDGNADWSALGQPTQDLCGSQVDVPVLLYQYAENCPCIEEGFSGFAGYSNSSTMTVCGGGSYPNNDLDMDASGTRGAETYMLVIA